MAKLQRTQQQGVTVLKLQGELTQEGVEEVEPSFAKATTGNSMRVVTDLAGVKVMTTPAITMLLEAMRRVELEAGHFVLTGTIGRVDDILRRCRLDQILTISPTLEGAIKRAKS